MSPETPGMGGDLERVVCTMCTSSEPFLRFTSAKDEPANQHLVNLLFWSPTQVRTSGALVGSANKAGGTNDS